MLRAPASAGTAVTMKPFFDVDDWDESLPMMMRIVEQAAEDQALGLSSGSWTCTDNDQALWRSTFDNVGAMLENLNRIAPILTAMDAGPAPLNRIEFHGTSDDLKAIQQNMPSFRANDLSINFFDSGSGFQAGSVDRKDFERCRHACSFHPHFTVKDWAVVEPIMNRILTTTSDEEGCLHLGWTRSGDSLQWHGDYVNGEALKAHFEKVKPLLLELVAGPATLVRMDVHGPAAELEKSVTLLDNFEPVHFFKMDERVPSLLDLASPLPAPQLT